jgi:hypothetical protein
MLHRALPLAWLFVPSLALAAPPPSPVILAPETSPGPRPAEPAPRVGLAPEPVPPAPADVRGAIAARLDESEPPFAGGDYSWMNGSNRQPDSLLKLGPAQLSLIVDAYYLWSFRRPQDHTTFPSSTAPRHNEVSLNLASFGLEIAPGSIDGPNGGPIGGPIGQLSVQYGNMPATENAQDGTLTRGAYLDRGTFLPLRTASAGWHFHKLHGVNLEMGLMSSFIGMDSYIPQENWNYLHPFVADFTPFYFTGARAQLYPAQNLKIELWAINGWQTIGQWHEARALGFLIHGRVGGKVILSTAGYGGRDAPTDDRSLRLHSSNMAQWKYYGGNGALRSLALAATFDGGHEHRGDGGPSGYWVAGTLSHRAELRNDLAWTLRGDIFRDEAQTLLPSLPAGNPYVRPEQDKTFTGTGFATTLDAWPSPWLLVRLEYMHRTSNIPLFSGPGGISGPGGLAPTSAAALTGFTPDLRKTDDRIVLSTTLRL